MFQTGVLFNPLIFFTHTLSLSFYLSFPLSYKTPTKLKDKCLAYILAMTLILEEYRVDPTLLAKDMNLSLAK